MYSRRWNILPFLNISRAFFIQWNFKTDISDENSKLVFIILDSHRYIEEMEVTFQFEKACLYFIYNNLGINCEIYAATKTLCSTHSKQTESDIY